MIRAAVALLLALPLAGRAFDWSGQLGLYYARTDVWSAAADHQSVPNLTLDASLGARGSFPEPGILDLSARAGYRWHTSNPSNEASTRSNELSYQLALGLLENPTSHIRLHLDASRERREFLTSPDLSGDGTTSRYGGSIGLRLAGEPAATASYVHEEMEETFPSLDPHWRDREIVAASFRNGIGPFMVLGTFNGDWSDGSWIADNFVQQFLNVQATGRIAGDWNVNISDGYSRRTPTATGLGAYGTETNGFRAAIERTVLGLGRSITYSYIRSATTASSVSDAGESQGLAALYDVPIDGNRLYVRTTGSLDHSELTSTTAAATSTGETLGADLWWRRNQPDSGLDVHGGPIVAAVQSDPGGSGVGYGASAGVSYTRQAAPLDLQASYGASYGNDVRASLGWSFRQELQGALSGVIGTARWSATATGSFARSSSPVFGDGASRSLALTASLLYETYSVFGSASVSDGAPSGGTFSGDGLFVQAPYVSHNRAVQLGIAGAVWEALNGTLQARYVVSDSPGAPSLDLMEAEAALSYRYGGLDFRLRDRLSSAESRYGRDVVNIVELRLSRALGNSR